MSEMSFSKILSYCFLISIITCTVASSAESLPESDHNYANNFDYTWPAISEPNATQMRLHFSKLSLASNDNLIILDENGNTLVKYYRSDNREDLWTEWYTGNTMKVRLVTDKSRTSYGFKVDKVETRQAT